MKCSPYYCQVYTSLRHFQTNSKAERYNKNILNSLRTRCNSEKDWLSLLSTIAFSFRITVVKSLGVFPFQLVFDKDPRLPIDELLLPPKNLLKTAQAYFDAMKPKLDIL